MKRLQSLAVFSLTIIFIGVLTPGTISGRADDLEAYDMLDYYFDLVRSGNYESANGMWEPSARTRADRLGIEYDGIAMKVDCNSPVIFDLDKYQENLIMGIKGKARLDSGMVRLHFSLDTPYGMATNLYYAKKLGKDFWLTFPQDYYTIRWDNVESKYFRFHISPQKIDYFNTVASQSLDVFVDEIAAKINISPERMNLLAAEKIDYYLCRDDEQAMNLSGQKAPAFYDKAADAIISTSFPEYYLVVGLLVNFKLQHLPLNTLSVMEEGLSIALGGRWQRSSGVILDFGKYILDYDLTEVDSILTVVNSDDGTMSDITFPIDACLADYLFTTLDTVQFFELYRKLSGDIELIRNPNLEEIKNSISGMYGLDWSDFKTKFETEIGSTETHYGNIFPGLTETAQVELEKDGLTISGSDKYVQVKYSNPNQEMAQFRLLFDKRDELAGKKSSLFEEMFKDNIPFEGYRYGLVGDVNEIGLYDYGVNQLIAKYVFNFNPDPAYFDSTTKTISAYFNLELLDDAKKDFSDFKMIE